MQNDIRTRENLVIALIIYIPCGVITYNDKSLITCAHKCVIYSRKMAMVK